MIITNNLLIFTKWCTPVAIFGAFLITIFGAYSITDYKRQWGYNHTNLNGLEKVGGEHALILLVYNIKRSMNILGVPDLIEKLKNFKHPYMKDGCFVFFRVNFKPPSALLFFQQKMAV